VTAKLKVMPGKIHSVYGCDDEMSVEALGTAAADFLVLTQTPTRATWLASRGEHRLASVKGSNHSLVRFSRQVIGSPSQLALAWFRSHPLAHEVMQLGIGVF
jgi:hypothetical protein